MIVRTCQSEIPPGYYNIMVSRFRSGASSENVDSVNHQSQLRSQTVLLGSPHDLEIIDSSRFTCNVRESQPVNI